MKSSAATMHVEVELKETSQKLVYDDVLNTYTKGALFVIYREGGMVVKFPLDNIWRVTEDYSRV